ncbi:MAG: ATP-binding protein, partial [Rhodococcus fascians]
EFDGIRALFDTQNQHLTEARTAGIANLDDVRTWRNVVLIGISVVLIATAIALALVMRSAVTRPLAALAASCRRITEGDFGERIVPQGPKDIRAMAADVEDMRWRIVEELESSRLTSRRLDEQTVELRRSNAELEQFAYVASHDLQEPLRKVTSFCQLIEKRYGDKLDERGVEYIAFAVDGAKRMQVLINDLLTFSRVGRLNSAETDVALDDALETGLANLSTAIDESGAEIARPAEPLPTVIGDPTLLAMLWQNLVGNAMKFRKDGVAPRILIECEPRPDDEQWLITMSDNGIGIAPEFVEKVFVIFQRLHGRDSYGGTGIGLALCKKIVEHHGGTIWIDTDYTDGTRFRFTLPMSAALAQEEPAALSEGSPR